MPESFDGTLVIETKSENAKNRYTHENGIEHERVAQPIHGGTDSGALLRRYLASPVGGNHSRVSQIILR